jgi:hypothetical protein
MRFFSPSQQFLDASGRPLSGGVLSFYRTGTTTPATVYSDSALAVPRGTSVTLDSAGRSGDVFLDPSFAYKVTLVDASGSTVFTSDPIGSPPVVAGPGVALDASNRVTIDASFLRGYLSGLTLSNNATTPNTKIDIAAGVCTDDGNTALLKLSSATVDCGTVGANGLDSGSLPATGSVHLFAIGKSDLTTAFIASTSLTPTLPTGYVYKRRIGSLRTDASNHFLAFVQDGDDFLLKTWPRDYNTTPTLSTATLVSLSVPTGISVNALIATELTGGGGGRCDLAMWSPLIGSTASAGLELSTPASTVAGGDFEIKTNTSGQIYIEQFSTVAAQQIWTRGWRDSRGRLG